MYVNEETREVYIRIPGTGSTSFLKHHPGFTQRGAKDHETLYQAMAKEHWGGCGDFTKITMIRHPMQWLTTMYVMCRRSRAHWRQFIGADLDGNASEAMRRRVFLERMPPLRSWVENPVTGEVLVDVVHRVEDMSGMPHLNATSSDDKDKYAPLWSAADLLMITGRFDWSLSHYSKQPATSKD